MAAQIHLEPDPIVMAVTGGLFLASVYTSNALILQPYLKLRANREKNTGGEEHEAIAILKNNASQQDALDKELNAAILEARQVTEEKRRVAHEKRVELIAAAENDANHVIEEMKRDIAAQLDAERANLPDAVKTLSQELYSQTVN